MIGSNTVVEAKGKRVRGRLYPWGIVEGMIPIHEQTRLKKVSHYVSKTHFYDRLVDWICTVCVCVCLLDSGEPSTL